METPSSQADQALKDFRDGRVEAALEGFSYAREAYQSEGDVAKAAEMANNLSVAHLKLENPEQALRAVEGTPKVFKDLGDKLNAARAYGNLGSALEATGSKDDAEAAYKNAISLFSEIGDKEGESYTLQSLSKLQLNRGRPVEALASMEASMEAKQKRSLRERLLQKLFKIPFRLLDR